MEFKSNAFYRFIKIKRDRQNLKGLLNFNMSQIVIYFYAIKFKQP